MPTITVKSPANKELKILTMMPRVTWTKITAAPLYYDSANSMRKGKINALYRWPSHLRYWCPKHYQKRSTSVFSSSRVFALYPEDPVCDEGAGPVAADLAALR